MLRVITTKARSAAGDPDHQLVPGRYIKTGGGDDPGRFTYLCRRDLFVAQASLNCEPCLWKKPLPPRQPVTNAAERIPCFMGTTVVSGTAREWVDATGANTWSVNLAGRVSEQESEPNAFLSRGSAASVCC